MKKGFTLIELLVVISIIGILLALSIFGIQGARRASRDAERKASLETIRQALELYKSDCDEYPSTLGTSLEGTGIGNCVGTYLSEVPTDPLSSDEILEGQRNFSYTPDLVELQTYTLCAAMEQNPASSSAVGCGSCGTTCNYKVTNP